MKLTASFVATAASFFAVIAAFREEQVVLSQGAEEHLAPFNVAIIGAGAAGASSAYHLSKFAAANGFPVNITVFERNTYIGGRTTTVNAYDDPDLPVELGGSIFVQLNRIMVDAVKEFKLSTGSFRAANDEIPGASLAVWDGRNFVVTQESEGGWWDIAKLLWKYGLAPLKTRNLMKSTTGQFMEMYEEPVFPFKSLTQAVQDVGLLPATSVTGEQYMNANGIKGAFGHDIVQASTRVNYAQNLKYIHGLEAMVCMAAEGAMAVEGGNWQIFDNMIAAANATTMLETEVSSLERRGDSYLLSYHNAVEKSSLDLRAQLFDAVILAAPYQFADLNVTFALPHTPEKIPYVELHVTLLTSPHLLSPAFFGLPVDKPAPKVILTTLPLEEEPKEGADGCGSPGFFSISLLRLVINPHSGQQEYLYKIFSPSPPDSTFLTHLLGLKQPHDHTATGIGEKNISWLHRKVWHSYPYELPRVTFEEIQLDENLWYTSGIESLISTMETSSLSGMNVARLVVDKRRAELANDPASFDAEIITVFVGPCRNKLSVHGSHLGRTSDFFRAALKTQWKEGQAREVTLQDDDEKTVQMYLTFAYTGDIACKEEHADESPDAAIHTREYSLLAHAYVFGEKYQDIRFKNAVLAAFIAKGRVQDVNDTYWYPTDTEIDVLYRGTPPKSPARRLMVDLHVAAGEPEWLDNESNNADFILDLARKFLAIRHGSVKDISSIVDIAHVNYTETQSSLTTERGKKRAHDDL
ncbi:hypothetical protein LTR36_006840 [Oleoguttula mirabilis]|uniref:BTB domain-containing protein n=1 Tax=Oleoguttula mirabilis TaxID=1507867 RepID=A0AAV9JC57_9PEZI|nr:hypothetical protein LTR36_006840 [Oleoguttula mirabilis]